MMVAGSRGDTDPSHCLHDASQALKEIDAGNATGFKPSLYGRAAVEGLFEMVGTLITLFSPVVAIILLCTILVGSVLLSNGFRETDLETSVAELWIEKGGRLDSEIEYTEDHLDEGFSQTQEPIIQLVSDNFTASLYDHLHILKAASELTVQYKQETYIFRDICSLAVLNIPQVPELHRVANDLAPCLFLTAVDCFWEGAILQEPDEPIEPIDSPSCANLANGQNLTWENLDFEELRDCLLTDSTVTGYTPFINGGVGSLQLTGYINRPCFSSECPPDLELADPVQEAIVNGCTGYSSLLVEPPSLIYSGDAFERDPSVALPAALRGGIILNGPATTQNNLKERRNITLRRDEVEDLLTRWKERFFDLVTSFNKGAEVDIGSRGLRTKVSNDQIYAFTSETLDKLSEEFADASIHLIIIGYILMIIYCAIAFLYFDWVNSHASVGLMGLLLVALASAAALGLTAACGISFNITTTQIFPFLVLGLGLDDMFVIGDAFFEIQYQKGRDCDIKTLLVSTVRAVGPSITLTSLTNSAGFLLSAIIPIPAIRNFAIQVGLAVIFNYFALLLGLPSFILIDHYRVKAKLVDFFCCFPAKICCLYNDEDLVAEQNGDTKAIKAEEATDSKYSNFLDRFRRYKSPLTTLIVDYYSPFLQNYIVKLVIIVLFTIWFGICIWGCTKVEDGLNIDDVVPAGTVEHSFASANVEHFASYSMRINTKNIDYANRDVQRALRELSEEVKLARYVVDAGGFTAYWLTLMTQYFTRLDYLYCTNLTLSQRLTTYGDLTQLLVATYLSLNFTEDPPMVLGGKIAQCNSTLTGLPQLVEYDQHGSFIPEERFYWYIPIWASLDESQFILASPSFYPTPPEGSVRTWAFNNSAITSYGPIVYAEHNLFCEGLEDTPDFENLINGIRDLLGTYVSRGINSYPSGTPFLFWEQYINLRRNVGIACGLILVACFIATSFFLMDLWSAMILVCMLAIISAEVFGMTGFLDIKFSSVPAIMIIASVGVSVEFTAPLTFYFLKSTANPGEKEMSVFGIQLPTILATWLVTRNERMHKALENRFTPIFNGSVTTFLGIIMLAFAELPFIRQYFFAILLSIVLLGLLNGLILLPVILSLFGPPAQARPIVKNQQNGASAEMTNEVYNTEVL